jgi:hypothetical protein
MPTVVMSAILDIGKGQIVSGDNNERRQGEELYGTQDS